MANIIQPLSISKTVTKTGIWSGLPGGNSISGATASTLYNAYGFGVNPLGTSQGYSLATGIVDSVLLTNNQHFFYDKWLDSNSDGVDIIDKNNSGTLEEGKYFRILENGQSITNILRVKAKVLSYIDEYQTPMEECWVDPATGKITIPQPTFWNKFTDEGNLLNPTNRGSKFKPSFYYSGSYSCGHWGWEGYEGRLVVGTYGGSGSSALYYYLFNNFDNIDVSAGHLSLAAISFAQGQTGKYSLYKETDLYFYINNETYIQLTEIGNPSPTGFLAVVHNGVPYYLWYIGDRLASYWPNGYPLMISWNCRLGENGLDGTNNLRVQYYPFYGGMLQTFEIPLTLQSPINPYIFMHPYTYNTTSHYSQWAYAWIDNLKIWLDNVKSTTWAESLYNKIDGEHWIYNIANDYKPNLENSLSYYYIAESNNPITVVEPALVNNMQTMEDGYIAAPGAYFINQGLGQYISGTAPSRIHSKFIAGFDYYYNESLAGTGAHLINIIDTLQVGNLESGKHLRILHNSQNVLGTFEPIAKQINMPHINNPPSNQCWVDPEYNCIILPRPAYWSTCDSLDSLTHSKLHTSIEPYSIVDKLTVRIPEGKFNNALSFYNNLNLKGTFQIYPFGNSVAFNSGTLSMWLSTVGITNLTNSVKFKLYFNDSTYFMSYNYGQDDTSYIAFVVNDITQMLVNTSINQSLFHLYVVWDINKTLDSNTKTFRLFINGQELLYSDTIINMNILHLWGELYNNPLGEEEVVIDNIKIWDHVVVEDPAWEYNSGNGRENNLHYLYGLSNNYQPSVSLLYNNYLPNGNRLFFTLNEE
jgi:hypothetical protein